MTVERSVHAPVVVGVDGSDASLRSVQWAASAAAARGTQLVLTNAIGPWRMGSWVLPEQLRTEFTELARSVLADAERAAQQVGDVAVVTRVADVGAPDALIEASHTASIVVVGSSGNGRLVSGLALGSVAIQVSTHAHGPVVIVRGRSAERIGPDAPVVVGFDGSLDAGRALEEALIEARLRDVRLIVTHAWRDLALITSTDGANPEDYSFPEVRRSDLADMISEWTAHHPDVDVELLVVPERPRAALRDLSGRAQLVVVGSRGRGGVRGLLLGSTSQALIYQADCPVMVVRPAPPGVPGPS